MGLDLARTPTIEAVSTDDEHALAQDLHRRVEEAAADADAREDVAQASVQHRAAEARLQKLRKAERALTAYAKQSRERMAAAEKTAMEDIIASAGDGESKIDFRKLNALAGLEHRNRLTSRAITHMVEEMIPLAHIVSLRAEAHALATKARAMEAVAEERAVKVLGALRAAVSDEMVLPVDMSKGVAGALVAYAAGLKRCALEISENADRMERAFQRRSEMQR